jgi:hypothetical protein
MSPHATLTETAALMALTTAAGFAIGMVKVS